VLLIKEDHVTTPPTTGPAVPPATPLGGAPDLGAEPAPNGGAVASREPESVLPRLRPSVIWALVVLTFGTSMAMVVPLAYSLTVRLAALAPGREDLLGYIIGAGAVANVLTAPLMGVLGDRTRTRLGRRRPWAIGGAVAGLLGLGILATAQSVLVLGVGWVVTLLAWQAAGNQSTYFQGDALPEEQRGRVAALNGFANLVAPIIGIAMVSSFSSNPLALFLLPGVVAVIGVILFVTVVREGTRELAVEPVRVKEVFSKYLFDPRRHPDFGWNWLGRFILFFGLAFTTTYGTFFLANRMDLPVEEVGGYVAVMGLGGVAAGALGAIGAGFLSDRLRRRKVFVFVAGVLALAGTLISASAHSFMPILIGSVLNMLAIGVFSTVDQAIVLDVLPERAQSGRFIAIMNQAQQIPTAIGPLVAPIVLGIAVTATSGPNYSLLYILSGVLCLLGSLVVILRVRSVR
jgi:MFS family permease